VIAIAAGKNDYGDFHGTLLAIRITFGMRDDG
jgi:hypothetical protein